MNNRKRLIITIVISGVSFFIGYFVNFYLTRFITDNIGTAAQGYITLSKTIATYVVIATTALNSYSSRFIVLEYHKGNIEKANVYFNSVFWANLVVGVFFCILSVIISPFLSDILLVPRELSKDVCVLFFFVFFNLCITLSFTSFQASAYIKDKLIVVSIARGISYLVEAITLLCLYGLFPAKIFYSGLGLVSASIVNSFGYLYITKKYTTELKLNKQLVKMSAIKELVIAGIWNSFNSLGNTLNSGLDLIVSNSLLSGVAMGQVSIVKSLVNIFSNLYQMVSQPFQPSYLKNYAKGDMKALLKDIRLSIKISGLISNIAFAGVVGYGLAYFKLWIPNQNTELLYRLTVIAVATSILEGAMYPLYYIYTLTVKNKIPCIITIVGGLLNVLGMIILIKNTSLDIYAIFITTAIIMTLINGVTNPIYMAHCLGIKYTSFYPEIIRHLISCAVITVVFKCIAMLFPVRSWLALIISIILVSLLGSIIHIIIVFDFSELVNAVRKIKDKKKRIRSSKTK